MITPREAPLKAFLDAARPYVRALREEGWDIELQVDIEEDIPVVHLIYRQPKMLVPVEAAKLED